MMFKTGDKVRLKKQKDNKEQYFITRYEMYKNKELTITRETKIGKKQAFELYDNEEYIGTMYKSEIEHIKERNEI